MNIVLQVTVEPVDPIDADADREQVTAALRTFIHPGSGLIVATPNGPYMHALYGIVDVRGFEDEAPIWTEIRDGLQKLASDLQELGVIHDDQKA